MSDLTQRIAELPLEDRIRLEERLLAARKNGSSQRIPRRAGDGPAPVSFTQERLWFLAQLEPDSSAYNEASVIRLRGPLDVPALERSLDALSERHDSLRVCFREIDDELMQVADALPPLRIPMIDLHALAADVQMSAAWVEIDKITDRIFALTQPPLWRVALIRLAVDDHIFVRVTHHIISDGWSSGIFWRELPHFYAAFAEGKTPAPLPELPVSYADFSAWQRQHLQGERLTKLVDYWRERLAGIEPLRLPTDRPRPPQPSHRGARFHFTLERDLSDSLSALARESGASLYMLLLAAFQTLLHRYSGQEVIVVGSPIANRSKPELEGIYGFFANTLALRADFGGNPTFRSLLEQVRQNALSAYQHQDLPFEKLVEELHPERDMSRSPVVDVLFALQNAPRAAMTLMGMELSRLERTAVASKFDLSFFLQERDGNLYGRVEYATDLFDTSTIHRMAGHFQTLLAGIVAAPDSPIGALPLLTDAERRQLLHDWSHTATIDSPYLSVVQSIQKQAVQNPASAAIEDFHRIHSYAQLNAEANRTAHWLRRQGVTRNTRVGLLVKPETCTFITLLAILKAGGAYIPLDDSLPTERLSRMLALARPEFIVWNDPAAPSPLPGQFPDGCTLLKPPSLTDFPESEPQTATAPDDTAYVLFTSGSTGEPKAIAQTYRTLDNLAGWQRRDERLGRPSRTLQLSSLTFDVSLQEVLTTWSTGGTLVIPPLNLKTEPAHLLRFIAEQQIERLFLPYTLLQLLAEQAQQHPALPFALQEIISAGEALHLTPSIRGWMGRMLGCRLHNHYGPTETHVVTAATLDGNREPWPSAAPIGRPIANTQIYLLDSHRQPVPIGVPGELYVGGAGLALGYLNRPDLTAERFVSHPFSDEPGARLYRTGDLARYREDGVLEFLGRIDRQVKIRGFRVEPGEIEVLLRQHPAVADCLVALRKDEKLGEQLIAWWVGKAERTDDNPNLRGFLSQRLPDYMLPAAFVRIDAFPLTPNGKVDQRALPAPQADAPDNLALSARNPLEQQLLGIWQKTLGRKHLGVEDNFFDVGGHSLLAVRLMDRVSRATGQELPVASLFYGPTIRQQAVLIEQQGWTPPWRSLVPVQPGGNRPPLFLVPPAASSGMRFANLARFLDAEQPIYGFDPSGLDGRAPIHTAIEEMAAHFVQELRQLQPVGPYLIGGMCFGGHVAYEMAQQLGDDAPVVLLLDAGQPANGPTWALPPRNLLYYLRRLLEHGREGHQWEALRNHLRSRWRRLSLRLYHWSDRSLHRMGAIYGSQLPAMRNYRASPTKAKLILFQSDDPMVQSRQQGWGELSERLEIIPFPNTTHRSLLLEDENVERIAEKLQAVIDRWVEDHWQDRPL